MNPMSGQTHLAVRNGDEIRVTVLNLGRARFAKEKAEELLEPGEVADETAGSWPIYMYKARRVAECVLLTPEERAALDDALGMADRYLAQALGIESQTGREMIIEKMGKLEVLRKKVRPA